MPLVLVACVLTLAAAQPASAQTEEVFVDPNRSVPSLRRTLVMNANQVSTDITNYGLVGRGNASNPAAGEGGVWPRGTGHDHIHSMTGFVAARVIDASGNAVYIASDGYADGGGSTSERDEDTNIEYKFHPLPGYSRQGQDDIANALNPDSWPLTWPGEPSSFDGQWNGFFGLNQFNADQEAVYVMDDTYNLEFDVAPYAQNPSWGGLGLQINTRLFQWAHPLAKDILFIQFQVTNAGAIDYNTGPDSVFFGGYADIGVGGRGSSDDCAGFDKARDLVYGWDCDNVGVWTRFRDIPPGYIGWKFLESPGIGGDGIDNDEDGITDELRDNDAGTLVFGSCGIYGEPQEHWSGDEDCDWDPEIDDKGRDGSGPLDEGYPGPDEGEGNGRPDQGEPNFGILDKDESDQVGLTSFTAPLFGAVQISDEPTLWPRIIPGFFTVPSQAVNQYWIFASGPFNLGPGETERFSTSWVFGLDERAAFQSGAVAQRIYDSDYRFARPPRQPVVQAIPGDGKVTLLWDDLAERSRDPVYGFDFEGYRVYRSTDPDFNDPRDVTDALGNPIFKVPLAQFDYANGLEGPHPLQFGETIGQPRGIHYYMGEDTGLQHYFVDDDVINGRTYYYAVTSYDAGYDVDFFDRNINTLDNLFPITPAESPAAIILDGDEVLRKDVNTVIVTPRQNASNVEEGGTDVVGQLEQTVGVATGTVGVEVVTPAKLQDASYLVTFGSVEPAPRTLETTTYTVTNETTGEVLVDAAPVPTNFADGSFLRAWQDELLEQGFVLTFDNRQPFFLESDGDNPPNTNGVYGWEAEPTTNLRTSVEPLFNSSPVEPISFVVEFTEAESDSAFTSPTGRSSRETFFKVYELGTQRPLDFAIQEQTATQDGRLDAGELIYLVYKPTPTFPIFRPSWAVQFAAPLDENGQPLPAEQHVKPAAGERYIVRNEIPFTERDRFRFSTTATVADADASESVLDRIKVVPNPYVGASLLERQSSIRGRGERIIRFINLPAQATIRIYTVAGDLVQTLEHTGLSDGDAAWDLRSKDGLEVAFGLYLYHVEAEGLGATSGKFAIIN